MGCGDDILNIGTGGLSGAVSSGSISGAISNLTTGGTIGPMTSVLPDSPLGRLIKSDIRTLTSGGVYNAEEALKYKNMGNQFDVFMDPSRTHDMWIRGSGDLFGKTFGNDARQIFGNYVVPIVAGIAGGGVGAFAGSYLGNKFVGGSNDQGLIKGAVAFGGSVLGGAVAASGVTGEIAQTLAPTIGQTAAKVAAQAVVSAATNAAMAAATSAAMGKDAGEGALSGAIGGAIGGGLSTGLQSYAPQMSQMLQQNYGLSADAAAKLTDTAIKAGVGAATNAATNKDPLIGAIGGAVSGVTKDLTSSKAINNLLAQGATTGANMLLQPSQPRTSGAVPTGAVPLARPTAQLSPGALPGATPNAMSSLNPATRNLLADESEMQQRRPVITPIQYKQIFA